MSVIMFIVGFTIFFLYIVGLLYMINRSHNEQKKCCKKGLFVVAFKNFTKSTK